MTAPAGRVVVAGDWHANTRWAVHVLGQAARAGCHLVLHVGDFGIWPGPSGIGFLTDVDAVCSDLGITVLVTPGNHEDWDQIVGHPLTDRGDGFGAVARFSDHVAVLPRGHRFVLAGADGSAHTFASLGGAPSIDREYRVPGRSWWPGEMITAADVARTAAGGPTDYLLIHDAPEPGTRAVERIVTGPSSWSPRVLDYCAQGRALVTEAFTAVRPSVLFHGHYHVRDTATVVAGPPGVPFTCRVEALGADGASGNAVVLDVATGTVTDLPGC